MLVENKILGVNYRVFVFLCYTALFQNFPIAPLRTVGFSSILLLLLLGIFTFIRRFNYINKTSLTVFFIYLIYNLYSLLINITTAAAYYYFMQTAILIFILSLISNNLSSETLYKIASKLYYLYYLLIIIYIISYFGGSAEEMLWVLTVAFALQYFVILKSRRPLIIVVISVIIFFWAKERTLAVISVLIYVLYAFPFYKKKKILNFLFFLIIICMMVFPFVYTYLAFSGEGSEFNQQISEVSGKNFFSGRQVIWGVIIENLNKSPITGFGMGNNILLANEIEVSTHNLYLFLALQGGAISVFLFIWFMYTLWRQYKLLDNKIIRLSIAYFIGILITSGFGLILLANFLVYSIFLWIIIAFGIIESNYIKQNTE